LRFAERGNEEPVTPELTVETQTGEAESMPELYRCTLRIRRAEAALTPV
jgi:hypothetical protein